MIRSISNQGLVSPNVQLLPAGDPCAVYNKLSGEYLRAPLRFCKLGLFKSINRNKPTLESLHRLQLINFSVHGLSTTSRDENNRNTRQEMFAAVSRPEEHSPSGCTHP